MNRAMILPARSGFLLTVTRARDLTVDMMAFVVINGFVVLSEMDQRLVRKFKPAKMSKGA